MNKKYNLIVSALLISVSCFASNQAVVKSCKNKMRCQFYKFCVEKYNAENGTSVHVMEDEISDVKLKEEIKSLVSCVSFFDADGKLIAPGVNVKTGNSNLPLYKKSADYLLAFTILAQHDQPYSFSKAKTLANNVEGSLRLVSTFNIMKPKIIQDNVMICGTCTK